MGLQRARHTWKDARLRFRVSTSARRRAPIAVRLLAHLATYATLRASMCTIAVLFRVHPELPLVVAANRDEWYARPATPAQVLDEQPRVVGGRDEVKGGTWMGVTESGAFLGVTNQRTFREPDPALASRGLLALEAVHRGSVEAMASFFGSLDARDYNAFNVVFGDARALWVGYGRHDAARVELEPLPEGVHVLTNDRIGAPGFPKTERVEALLRPLVRAPWLELSAGLAAMLADHTLPPLERVPEPPPGSRFDHATVQKLQAVCIHTPVYGTRSSTILAAREGRVEHFLFADGAPCTHPFEDLTHLVHPS